MTNQERFVQIFKFIGMIRAAILPGPHFFSFRIADVLFASLVVEDRRLRLASLATLWNLSSPEERHQTFSRYVD